MSYPQQPLQPHSFDSSCFDPKMIQHTHSPEAMLFQSQRSHTPMLPSAQVTGQPLSQPTSPQHFSQQASPPASYLETLEQLVEEYRGKHPDLNEYELYIAAEVDDAIRASLAQGKLLAPREAIEAAIERFKNRFLQAAHSLLSKTGGMPTPPGQGAPPPLLQPSPQNPHSPQTQQNQVGRMALNMDLQSDGPVSEKLTPEAIWQMPREKFMELERKMKRQHYQ